LKPSRAYIAGLGTSGVLIASFLLLLAVVSAIVAFRGFPGAASNDGLDRLDVREDSRNAAALAKIDRAAAREGRAGSRTRDRAGARPKRGERAGQGEGRGEVEGERTGGGAPGAGGGEGPGSGNGDGSGSGNGAGNGAGLPGLAVPTDGGGLPPAPGIDDVTGGLGDALENTTGGLGGGAAPSDGGTVLGAGETVGGAIDQTGAAVDGAVGQVTGGLSEVGATLPRAGD